MLWAELPWTIGVLVSSLVSASVRTPYVQPISAPISAPTSAPAAPVTGVAARQPPQVAASHPPAASSAPVGAPIAAPHAAASARCCQLLYIVANAPVTAPFTNLPPVRTDAVPPITAEATISGPFGNPLKSE